MTTCPCCGHPVTAVPVDALMSGENGQSRIILEQLVTHYPMPVSSDDLKNAVFAHLNGRGAQCENNAITSVISKLRRRLVNHGWTIPIPSKGRGVKGMYRLERMQ